MEKYSVKCDECGATIRETENVQESYQGATCEDCLVIIMIIKGRACAIKATGNDRFPYRFRGKHRAKYTLMRCVSNQEMFIIDDEGKCASVFAGVRLTDEGGPLRVLRR